MLHRGQIIEALGTQAGPSMQTLSMQGRNMPHTWPEPNSEAQAGQTTTTYVLLFVSESDIALMNQPGATTTVLLAKDQSPSVSGGQTACRQPLVPKEA